MEKIVQAIREQVAQEMREQLSRQSKQQSEQISQLLLTKTANQGGFSMHKKGGTKEMGRKLKYGEGSITKRMRLTYRDENNIRRIKHTSDEGMAQLVYSEYKCNIYEWYEVKWLDEYGKRHTRIVKTIEQGRKILSQFNKRTTKTEKYNPIKYFGILFQEWFDEFRKPGLGAGRIRDYQKLIDNIPKTIKNKIASQVTQIELQAHLNKIECGEPKWRTKSLLAAFYKYMFGNNIVKVDIGSSLIAERPTAEERQILEIKDESKFLDLMPNDEYRTYAVGIIYTGCRLSEFMTLNTYWETDIDYEKKIIKIRETKSIRERDKKRGVFYRIREIPLLPQIEQMKFPLHKRGEGISVSRFQEAFRKACEILNTKVTPHDMRHTFATRLDDAGFPEKVIQSILGHKDARMTKHYKNHKSKELLKSEYEKIRKSTIISTTVCI